MDLAGRLKRLELKVRPADMAHELPDIDQCIAHLGMAPAAVRELARSAGSSLAEAVCEMIGIDTREFRRELLGQAGVEVTS